MADLTAQVPGGVTETGPAFRRNATVAGSINKIYRGAIVKRVNATPTVVDHGGDDSACRPAGVALTDGESGDLIEVATDGVATFTHDDGSLTDANIGDLVYMGTDDNHVTSKASATNDIPFGVIVAVPAATKATVHFSTDIAALVFPENTLITDLASTATGKGASLIGIEDAGGYYDGTATVEGALQEVRADLAAVTASNGASLVGIQDAAGYYAGATVEAALAEKRSPKFPSTFGTAGVEIVKAVTAAIAGGTATATFSGYTSCDEIISVVCTTAPATLANATFIEGTSVSTNTAVLTIKKSDTTTAGDDTTVRYTVWARCTV